jgi:hypothetical protein
MELDNSSLMMEAVCTSETSVDSPPWELEISQFITLFTRSYNLTGASWIRFTVSHHISWRHILISRGSSVSIVSGYVLDNRAIEVWSLAEAKDFSCSLCVQTLSGAHPATCTMGNGSPLPWLGRDAHHSPHLVPRSRMNRSYISSPPARPLCVVGLLYLNLNFNIILPTTLCLCLVSCDV